jgi:hypothetical protein
MHPCFNVSKDPVGLNFLVKFENWIWWFNNFIFTCLGFYLYGR